MITVEYGACCSNEQKTIMNKLFSIQGGKQLSIRACCMSYVYFNDCVVILSWATAAKSGVNEQCLRPRSDYVKLFWQNRNILAVRL